MAAKRISILLVLTVLMVGCDEQPHESLPEDTTGPRRLHEAGSVTAANTVEINSPGWGRANRIGWLIPEGTLVAAGDTVAMFDEGEMLDWVQQNTNELVALRLSEAGARAQEQANRTRTRNTIQKARLAMENAELAAENQRFESKNVRDAAELEGRQAAIGLEQARRDSVSQAVLDSLEIAQTRLKTEKQEARVERYRTYLKQLVMTAPAAGMVVYHREYTEEGIKTVRVGDEVHRQAPILEITDTSVMKVEFSVHEIDRWRLAAGQSVRIVLDAYPEVEYEGTLEKVDRMPRFSDEGTVARRFGVTAVIKDEDPRLKPGMSARVIIDLGGST